MRWLLFLAPLFATPAAAQVAYPPSAVDVSTLATKVEMAGMCPPGSTLPSAEDVTATAGTASTCLRSDAKLPRITRAGMAPPTDGTGTWSMTWATPLPAVPVTLPLPMNSGTQPIVCNVTTSTATGASGRCWLARTLPSTLLTLVALVNFDPNGAPASGITVQVLAIPVTQ
jgi:hypothetical protein